MGAENDDVIKPDDVVSALANRVSSLHAKLSKYNIVEERDPWLACTM